MFDRRRDRLDTASDRAEVVPTDDALDAPPNAAHHAELAAIVTCWRP